MGGWGSWGGMKAHRQMRQRSSTRVVHQGNLPPTPLFHLRPRVHLKSNLPSVHLLTPPLPPELNCAFKLRISQLLRLLLRPQAHRHPTLPDSPQLRFPQSSPDGKFVLDEQNLPASLQAPYLQPVYNTKNSSSFSPLHPSNTG